MIEVEEGDLDDEEVEQLINGLKAQAEDSLGMAMVYTLAGYLQESLAELVKQRKERIAKAEAEAYRLAEEVSLIRSAAIEPAILICHPASPVARAAGRRRPSLAAVGGLTKPLSFANCLLFDLSVLLGRGQEARGHKSHARVVRPVARRVRGRDGR